MGCLLRLLELVFALYFASHIPITILFDSQSVVPKEYHHLYPEQVRNLTSWYVSTYKDTFFVNPPTWYKTFVYCEQAIQLPFFFVAFLAFLKGSCKWIRTPILIYGTHVATTVLPMLVTFWTEDFSKYSPPGPATQDERMMLISFYLPYFLVPVLLVLTMLMSGAYNDGEHTKTIMQHNKGTPKRKHHLKAH